jgi:hypothetical protein
MERETRLSAAFSILLVLLLAGLPLGGYVAAYLWLGEVCGWEMEITMGNHDGDSLQAITRVFPRRWHVVLFYPAVAKPPMKTIGPSLPGRCSLACAPAHSPAITIEHEG